VEIVNWHTEKEPLVGEEDWLNYTPEFVFVAHEDAEMEMFQDPKDSE
jgi:hypothetical protein